jgi:methionyl-tRNA synthetase
VHDQSWGEALKPLPPNHKIQKATPLFKKIEGSSQELQDKLESIRERLGKSG